MLLHVKVLFLTSFVLLKEANCSVHVIRFRFDATLLPFSVLIICMTVCFQYVLYIYILFFLLEFPFLYCLPPCTCFCLFNKKVLKSLHALDVLFPAFLFPQFCTGGVKMCAF